MIGAEEKVETNIIEYYRYGLIKHPKEKDPEGIVRYVKSYNKYNTTTDELQIQNEFSWTQNILRFEKPSKKELRGSNNTSVAIFHRVSKGVEWFIIQQRIRYKNKGEVFD